MAGAGHPSGCATFPSSPRERKAAGLRLTSLLVALSLLALTLAGCVNTRVRSRATGNGQTSAAVSIYLKKADWREGGPTVNGVVTELYLLRNGRPQLLCREDRGRWALSGLVPGRYEVRVGRLRLTDGEEGLEGDTRESFALAEGESAEVRIILEKKPVLLIAGLGAAAVAAAIILHNNDVDLPDPPGLSELESLAHHLPPLLPPARFLELGVEVMIPPCGPWGAAGWPEASGPAGWQEEGEPAGEPAEGGAAGWPETEDPAGSAELLLTDHSPVHGSTGVPREANIRFQFNLPVDPASLDHRCLLVTGGAGERIAGGIDYLEESRTCVFDPLLDLPASETITVTLAGGYIRTPDGRELAPNYRWSFTTAAAE